MFDVLFRQKVLTADVTTSVFISSKSVEKKLKGRRNTESIRKYRSMFFHLAIPVSKIDK
jgi:hypothetical protein